MWDCIIIGAGPSGLMAGIIASSNSKTLIIEKNTKPGKKLLLTGNGRSNITNLKENNLFLEAITHNKKYLYSTINNFGPYDIYNFFIKNNVPLQEEEENKIFPSSNKASDILNALIKNTNNIEFKYNETVTHINYHLDNIEVTTNHNRYQAKNIIIATGGASFKQTGSTGDHMEFAKQLNQPSINLYPAEVGVILKEKTNLQGTAFNKVKVTYQNHQVIGKLIYTHKGLSGSAIMALSEYIYQNENKTITIDFLPDQTIDELCQALENYNKDKELVTFLTNYFSKRFSLYLINKIDCPPNTKIKHLNHKQITNLVVLIKKFSYQILRVDDLNNAYITGGGIDMKYINSKTMESTIKKGVYFVGEALDIHGPIGGYNLTLALSTGYTAGKSISKTKKDS